MAEAGAPLPGAVAEELAARTAEPRDYRATIVVDLWARGVRMQVRGRAPSATPARGIQHRGGAGRSPPVGVWAY
jgi:hypothetical protein